MNLPHPKTLIPALFGLVAGVPMLLQTSLEPMAYPAAVTDVAQQMGIDPDALINSDVQEADYGYEAGHYINRSLRNGSCSEAWKTINKGVYLLCKRTLAEMGSDRSDAITSKMLRLNKGKMHSAATTGKTINDRFGVLEPAKPEDASEIPRFRYRRDGPMPKEYQQK